ncbi:MAG: transposase [Methanobrevibacter sp.]|nr:transposase [Methanobrevibacter sp.]
MSRQAYVNKNIPISEIRRVKRDLEKFVHLYEKVSFIEDLYADETVKDSIEKHGKTPQTGYKWLKDWNENGFDGLFRKGNSGRISKMSDYQFDILKENIVLKGLSNVSEIREEIQKEFGVTYSERHLRRLIFDLGLLDVMNSNNDI